MVLGVVQALFFIGVFTLFGARVEGGPVAVAVLVVVAVLLAVSIGGFAAGIGLRTGSQEAVQNFFPLVFVLLFISSAFFPTALMTGWFQWVAERNPLSWMMNAARDLVISDLAFDDVVRAVGIACGFAVVTVSFAAMQLRRRVRMP
jgi:ABC-2 type transport system permease protein